MRSAVSCPGYAPDSASVGLQSGLKSGALRRPDETITVFEAADLAAGETSSIYQDHTHSRNWGKGWNVVLDDIQPDRHRT